MIKNFVLLISLLSSTLFSWFGQPVISVNMDAPAEVQAGQEFPITLTIEKGAIQSFSRYTLDLPYGLTATRISTANADFSFEEQRVRMIWLKLPPDEKITVSFNVKVHQRLKGSFKLEGEFSYIDNNERKNIPVYCVSDINITPDSSIDKSQIVDIKDFEELVLPSIQQNNQYENLTVKRRKPIKTGNHELTIELEVAKKNLNKFAKIEEFIPQGFRAVEGDSKNGIFSFSQGVVKFLWMNLPEEPDFVVSYKIIPDPGKTQEELKISGSFSYITGNESKTIAIVEKNYDLAENTKTNNNEETKVVKEVEVITEIKDPVVEKEVKETEKEKISLIKEESKSKDEFTLQPEDGIYYRIQIAAGHRSVDIEKYFSKRSVSDDVKMEYHEGWKKYTLGSFYVYKDARDYRVKIWDTTDIDGAFVTAYNSGKRITVQEALLIANHQWYR
jgi:hypothetical protein